MLIYDPETSGGYAYDNLIYAIDRLEREKHGCEVCSRWLCRIRTTHGDEKFNWTDEENILLDHTEEDEEGRPMWNFTYDWYEGGVVELLGYIDLDDVEVPLNTMQEGFNNDNT